MATARDERFVTVSVCLAVVVLAAAGSIGGTTDGGPGTDPGAVIAPANLEETTTWLPTDTTAEPTAIETVTATAMPTTDATPTSTTDRTSGTATTTRPAGTATGTLASTSTPGTSVEGTRTALPATATVTATVRTTTDRAGAPGTGTTATTRDRRGPDRSGNGSETRTRTATADEDPSTTRATGTRTDAGSSTAGEPVRPTGTTDARDAPNGGQSSTGTHPAIDPSPNGAAEPGFGLATAAVALVLAVVVGRRRG